jgi:hypothetical protein
MVSVGVYSTPEGLQIRQDDPVGDSTIKPLSLFVGGEEEVKDEKGGGS